MNIMTCLKLLTIFTKKLHLRCFTRFCVRLCSEVTSSIYQTYKFKVYYHSFWRHVLDVVFASINETLCPLSDVALSKNLELLCATNTKTMICFTLSKEDVKWFSYLGVEYYSFHNNIIGFIIGFIITLLVSYVWKVCNETILPFVGSIFLCSSFTRRLTVNI